MIVIPDSGSTILRSANIIVFHIESTKPTEVPHQTNVGIRLTEIAKGSFADRPASLHRLRVTQYPNNGDTAPHGAWTSVSLEPGKDLVAFSNGGATLDQALNDPYCKLILPAGEALSDVLFARDAEAANLPPGNIAVLARGRASTLGPLGAEYITAITMKNVLPDSETFDRVMSLAEAPELADLPRQIVVESAAFKIADSDKAPLAIVRRCASALFHIAEMDDDAKLRARILDLLLPSVLGLNNGKPISAAEVFGGHDDEMLHARDVLSKYSSISGAQRLRAWLEQ